MTSHTPVQAQLDHLVILLPVEELHNLPSWLTDNFTISPGGKHADGLTENVLILLADGVYLELIAFTKDASSDARAKHRWDTLPSGVIDLALTLPGDVDAVFAQLQNRWREAGVDDKIFPPKLVDGGRTRPDGEVLKWRVATPDATKTGIANFWCMDVTPRHLRVPLSSQATTHPCGAIGIDMISVKAKEEDGKQLGKLFGAYLSSAGERTFSVDTPAGEPGSRSAKLAVLPDEDRQGEAICISLRAKEGAQKTIHGTLGGRKMEIVLN